MNDPLRAECPRPRISIGLALAAWSALAAAVATSRVTAQGFDYDIETVAEIHDRQIFDVDLELVSRDIPEGEKGVDVWQLSLRHEHLEIISATTSGTIVDELFQQGFERTEITTGPGNEGFTSAVSLSFIDDVTLPPDGAVRVASARYQVAPEACLHGAWIGFHDGLRGSGLPILNRVGWLGESFTPNLDAVDFAACRRSQRRLSLAPDRNPIVIEEDASPRFEVGVVLRQDMATAVAWSIAVSHDPRDLRLVDVAVDPGVLDEHIQEDGFALIEHTRGIGNSGFTARVELSASQRHVIPALEQTLLTAIYEPARELEGGEEILAELVFAEALRGSGGDVGNAVLPEGELELDPPLLITIRSPLRIVYRRGDANGDGSVDIGDPIATLNYLFRGSGIGCHAAAGINPSPGVDLSDVIYALNFLFQGGPPPAAPYPECRALEAGEICARSACD